MNLARRIASLGTTTAFGALVGILGACSSAEDSAPIGTSHQLLLLGNGESLELQGSLTDPTYRPHFKVAGVEKMVVTIDPRTGKLDGTCSMDNGTSSCKGIPFFGRATKDKSGSTRVIVKDRNGVVCADLSTRDDGTTTPTPAGTPPPSGSGSAEGTTAGSPSGNGSDQGANGGNSTNGGANGSGGEGGEGGEGGKGADQSAREPAGCSSADVDTLRTQFCAEVNAWLKSHGSSATLDCAKLDSDVPDGFPGAVDSDVNCVDINGAAYEKAVTATSQCSNDAQLRVENWESASRWQLVKKGACSGSPLVLDLDGNGIELRSFTEGPQFDLLGVGRPVQTGWITSGDAFLVLDRNNDGRIDGGRELFGTATAGRAYADGFKALAELDVNKDGRIDRRDPGFEALMLWRDNGDGQSSASELSSLRTNGIAAIELAAERVSGARAFDRHGNELPLVSRFIRDDGREGLIGDVFFRYRPVTSGEMSFSIAGTTR